MAGFKHASSPSMMRSIPEVRDSKSSFTTAVKRTPIWTRNSSKRISVQTSVDSKNSRNSIRGPPVPRLKRTEQKQAARLQDMQEELTNLKYHFQKQEHKAIRQYHENQRINGKITSERKKARMFAAAVEELKQKPAWAFSQGLTPVIEE